MSDMQSFLGDLKIIEPIGLALIASLWRGLVIAALVYLLFVVAGRMLQSRTRYIIAVAALGLVFAWTGVSLLSNVWSNNVLETALTTEELTFSETIESAVIDEDASASSLWIKVIEAVEQNISFVVFGWFMGVIILSVRLLIGNNHLNRMRRQSLEPPEYLVRVVERLKKHLEIDKRVVLRLVHDIPSPMAWGHSKPMIFLPVGVAADLTILQIETLILHELVHIKRCDYLVNLFQSLIETLLFFNPFVWYLSRVIRKERELVCDDAVVSRPTMKSHYIQALVYLVEQKVRMSSPVALGAGGHKGHRFPLLERIKRISRTKTQNTMNYRFDNMTVAMTFLGLLLLPILFLHLGSAQGMTIQQASDNDQNRVVSAATLAGFEKEGLPVPGSADELLAATARPLFSESDDPDTHPATTLFTIDSHAKAEDPRQPGPDEVPEMPTKWQTSVADMDTVPEPPPLPLLPPGRSAEMEELIKSMQESFREHAELWKKHGMEMDLLLNEDFHRKWKEMEELQQNSFLEITEAFANQESWLNFGKEMLEIQNEFLDKFDDDFMDNFEMDAKEFQEKFESMAEIDIDFDALREKLEAEKIRREQFEERLLEMLVEDGYVANNPGKEVEVRFDRDEVRVNGEFIIEKDRKRYLDLRDKHFPRDGEGTFRYWFKIDN